MYHLQEFNYLNDNTLETDHRWQKSYSVLTDAIENFPLTNLDDPYSCDYDKCWISGSLTTTYYAPGMQEKPWTGKRPLRTIAMLLTQTEVSIRGRAIVNVCPNPYCCNPAHLYSTSNKNTFLDSVRLGIQEEEWPQIRALILQLQRNRQTELDLFETQMQNHNGTPDERKEFEQNILSKYQIMQMSNDEILFAAVRQISKHSQLGNGDLTISQLVEQYQLRTEYNALCETHKKLLGTIFSTTVRRTKNVETFGIAFACIARLNQNRTLLEILERRGILLEEEYYDE